MIDFFKLSLYCFGIYMYSWPQRPLVYLIWHLFIISQHDTGISSIFVVHKFFNISFFESIYEIYSSLKCVYKIDIVIPFWDHCPWVRLSLKRHKTLKLDPPTLNLNNSIMSSFVHVHVFDIYTMTLLMIKYWTKSITESRTADRTFFLIREKSRSNSRRWFSFRELYWPN